MKKRKIKERESSVWAASNLPPFCLPLAAKEEEEEEGPFNFQGRISLLCLKTCREGKENEEEGEIDRDEG